MIVSTSKILTTFYQLLVSKLVHEMISGQIDKGRFLEREGETETIEINILNSRAEYVQSGYLNLNLILDNLQDGRANHARFEELGSQLIDALRSNTFLNVHFEIENISGVLPDEIRQTKSFVNYKFNFNTIN